MRVVKFEDIKKPFLAPKGEIIYEMIGRPNEIGGTKNHSLVHVSLPVGKMSSSHYHKVTEETYYILSGNATMTINGKSFKVEPNLAILIMPNEVHQIINDGEEQLEFLTISGPAWVPDDEYLCEMPKV